MKFMFRKGFLVIILIIIAFFYALIFPTLTQTSNLKKKFIDAAPIKPTDSTKVSKNANNQILDTMKKKSITNKKELHKIEGKKTQTIKKHHKLLKDKT